ncbi:MAG: SH3 domain-containing protein [Clostridiales bacterium]|nr:SH3 domain-containing protein [Clostridiales bacterium]
MKRWILVLLVVSLIGCSNTVNETNKSPYNQVSDQIEEETNEIVHSEVNDETDHVEAVRSVKVGVENLNVRQSASRTSEVVAQVHSDDVYQVLDEVFIEEELWYEIEKGWIAGWLTIDAKDLLEDYLYLYDHMDTRNIIGLSKDEDLGKLICIEVRQGKVNFWFKHNEGLIQSEVLDSSFQVAESLILRTEKKEQIIETSSSASLVERSQDGLYGIINLNEKVLVFDAVHNMIAIEDSNLDYYDDIYQTDYNTGKYDLNLGESYVQIIGKLENLGESDYYDGNYTCLTYEILEHEIASLAKEEVSLLQWSETVSLMDDLTSEDSISKYVEKEDLLKYIPEYRISFIDGHYANRYYYFDDDTYKGYAYIFDNLSSQKGTLVIDQEGNEYHLEGDLDLRDHSLLSRGYAIFSDKGKEVLVDVKRDIRIKYDQMFISPDFEHLVVKEANELILYTLTDRIENEQNRINFDDEVISAEWEDDKLILFIKGGSAKGYMQEDDERLVLDLDSLEITRETNVYEVHSGPSQTSKIIGEITVSELKKERPVVHLVLDDGLLKFCGKYEGGYVFEDYNYENEGSYIGYKLNAYTYKDIMTKHGTVLKGERGFSLRYSYKPIEAYGYVFLYSDSRLSGEDTYYYLYDLEKDKLIKVFNYSAYVDELDLLIEKEKIEDELFTLRFYRIEDEGLNLIGEEIVEGRYALTIDWSNDVLGIKVEALEGSDWLYANYYGYNYYFYDFKDGKIVKENKTNFLEEEVTLYEEVGKLSTHVSEMSVSHRNDIEFLETYQIIEDKIHLWFELKLDDQVYYIHRPFRENEYTGYDYFNRLYYIVLEDETIVEQDVIMDATYYYVRDDLGVLGYLSTYFSWEEGAFGRLLNMKTGEAFRTIEEVYLSPDKNHFFSYKGGYIMPELEFGIYSIDKDHIEELFTMRYGSWFLIDFEWENNTCLKMTIKDDTTSLEYDIYLELEGDSWVLKD